MGPASRMISHPGAKNSMIRLPATRSQTSGLSATVLFHFRPKIAATMLLSLVHRRSYWATGLCAAAPSHATGSFPEQSSQRPYERQRSFIVGPMVCLTKIRQCAQVKQAGVPHVALAQASLNRKPEDPAYKDGTLNGTRRSTGIDTLPLPGEQYLRTSINHGRVPALGCGMLPIGINHRRSDIHETFGRASA